MVVVAFDLRIAVRPLRRCWPRARRRYQPASARMAATPMRAPRFVALEQPGSGLGLGVTLVRQNLMSDLIMSDLIEFSTPALGSTIEARGTAPLPK